MPNHAQSIHKPVLLHEVVDYLFLRGGKGGKVPRVYLDGTIGGCGHALALAEALGGKLTIIGLDRDRQAIESAREKLAGKAERLILEHKNFRNLDEVLSKHGIDGVDIVLFDLGMSSDQLENSGRGFSFQRDEPLLMTMGDPAEYPFTAKDLVNSWKEEDIANVIFGYGGERFATKIARAIVRYREMRTIDTSSELAEIVKGAVPAFYRRGRLHPATKTFQAVRIAVNDELNALKEGLRKGWAVLAKGGRMAIISFHSHEDRVVKEFFREHGRIDGLIITKKPIRPGAGEIEDNSRARSAKLRISEKRVV
ncbi:16S rRNA (cytosine(1402)-N(4))-methyltransferase RsmH [Patescibacteria group bacterium]|nr:16S rRNA (cytosine(1402)-N(4))-methyltransferase RsmH [Patescibacteria group bacterium]MDE1946306.1 16S rRNA (cytosine(1402)-N(4))-methyltransferase RsmH [Patescibacteria group bacterium]MDE2010758.1 16S rRNA (cytosine(1402)-N(4))-methyltransferase RsmH [Patescibacteria group bacterium]MDE2232642.1 16S rRNA (cytosine(1402)-N(4))-methyltransferase RsmH [Patescibacteria group bacterium]